MPLWGKTDAAGSVPKFLSTADAANAVFVDATEAEQPEAKAKGITGPGWWLYTTYTNSGGVVRNKAECLVPIYETAANAGDQADDAVVPDRTILITTQPDDTTAAASADGVFTVVATVSPAETITYQWQVSTDTGTSWASTVDADGTGATLTILSTDAEYVDGNLFRVVVSSTGATSITSESATLTVTA